MALNTDLERIKPIGCEGFKLVTGTWTFTNAGGNSGVAKQVKTANAETTTVIIPVILDFADAQFGPKLKTINLPIHIATANLSSAATGTVYQTLISNPTTATPANVSANTVTSSINSVTNTNAADQLLTLSVTSPAFDSLLNTTLTAMIYKAEFTFVCASSTVLTVYDAWATFEDME